MVQLTKLDVKLHQMGYNTKAYNRYCLEMQHALDLDYYDRFVDDALYIYCGETLASTIDYRDIKELFPCEIVHAVRDLRMKIHEAYHYMLEEWLK